MRKKWKRYAAICVAGGIVMTQMTGCGSKSAAGDTPPSVQAGQEAGNQNPEGDASLSGGEAGGAQADAGVLGSGVVSEIGEDGSIMMTATLGEGGTKSVQYLAEDLDAGWDGQTATGIVLGGSGITVEGEGARSDGNTVSISQAGTYVVSGKLEDGQIRIEADDDAVIHLVLNGVELSSQSTAPIYSTGKSKVILTLETGTANIISDGSEYQYGTEGEDEPDAPIFTKGDLTINGAGSLEVRGNYQCGIHSKDNLMVVSGGITVDAQDDGLKGKDSVIIRDGVLDIRSVKDGIKSNNSSDGEKGFIWIAGGDITAAAQDDGIQAETALIVSGGKINITESEEALAGKTVDILGGLIQANASDDGINSAASVETEHEKMQDQDGAYTRIAGGEIHLNAYADGIDSNGDLYIEGGALYLSGPVSGGDGIIDYNGTGIITGGTVFAAGSSGMMQLFGENSAQNYLVAYYAETRKGGTEIKLTDASGKELGSFVPEKDYQAVIISSPEIQAGSTYHVATGDEDAEMEVNGVETVYGTVTGRGMGRPGGAGAPGEERGKNEVGRRGGMGRPDGEGTPEGRPDGKRPDGEGMPEKGRERPDMERMPEEGRERPDME